MECFTDAMMQAEHHCFGAVHEPVRDAKVPNDVHYCSNTQLEFLWGDARRSTVIVDRHRDALAQTLVFGQVRHDFVVSLVQLALRSTRCIDGRQRFDEGSVELVHHLIPQAEDGAPRPERGVGVELEAAIREGRIALGEPRLGARDISELADSRWDLDTVNTPAG
eukprot:gene11182-biopygen5569